VDYELFNHFNTKLDKLETKLKTLEEKINIIYDKSIYKNILDEHRRLLNAEYGGLVSKLRFEFKEYDPKKQLNLRKIFLSKLPENETHLSTYLSVIKNIINDKGYRFNLADFEILLYKLNIVKENMVCMSRLNKEILECV